MTTQAPLPPPPTAPRAAAVGGAWPRRASACRTHRGGVVMKPYANGGHVWITPTKKPSDRSAPQPPKAGMSALWRQYAACETCGARAGKPCTVGQYGSPSPHRSTRVAAIPHARRRLRNGRARGT